MTSVQRRQRRRQLRLMTFLSRSAPVYRGGHRAIAAALGYRTTYTVWFDLRALAAMGYIGLPEHVIKPSPIRILVPFLEQGATV